MLFIFSFHFSNAIGFELVPIIDGIDGSFFCYPSLTKDDRGGKISSLSDQEKRKLNAKNEILVTIQESRPVTVKQLERTVPCHFSVVSATKSA